MAGRKNFSPGLSIQEPGYQEPLIYMERAPEKPRGHRRFVQKVPEIDTSGFDFEVSDEKKGLLGKFRFVELENKTKPDDKTAKVAYQPVVAKVILQAMQSWISRGGGNSSSESREREQRDDATGRDSAAGRSSGPGLRAPTADDHRAEIDVPHQRNADRGSTTSARSSGGSIVDFSQFCYDCVDRFYARVPVSKFNEDLPLNLDKNAMTLNPTTLSIARGSRRARGRNNREDDQVQLCEISNSRVREIFVDIRNMPNVRLEPDFGDGYFCVNVYGAPCVLPEPEEEKRKEKKFTTLQAEEEWIRNECTSSLLDLHELDQRIKDLQADSALGKTFPYAITGLPKLMADQKRFGFVPPKRGGGARGKKDTEATTVSDPDALLREIMPLRQRSYFAMPSLDVPLGYTLYEYQKKALCWMVERENWKHLSGGILADDMGTGKTVTCAALLRHSELALTGPDSGGALAWQRVLAAKIGMPLDDNSGLSRRTLIVAPKGVLPVWQKHLKDLGVVTDGQLFVYHGQRKTSPKLTPDFSITLTTYATFWMNAAELSGEDLNGGWQRVLIDEGQQIRNDETKTAKALTEPLKARTRWIVSGTPVVNRTSDLRSMFKFLHFAPFNKDGFFRQWIDFTKTDKIEQKHKTGMLRMHRIVQPIMLRRSKAYLKKILPAHELPLPEKIEYKELVPLDVEEQRCYDFLVGSPEAAGINYLVQLLTRARQMVLNPGLLPRECLPESARHLFLDENHPRASSKMKTVAEIVFDRTKSVKRREPVIVFSFFKSFFKRLEPYLAEEAEKKRLSPFRIEVYDGDTPTAQREKIVQDFQDGQVQVLLCSLTAGGVGLTLPKGRTVILCDPWWNRPMETQAIDRIHRIGSTYKTVNIYRLVAKGTIEERILELQEMKNFEKEGVIDAEDEDYVNAIPVHQRNKLFTPMDGDERAALARREVAGGVERERGDGWWDAYDENVIMMSDTEENSDTVDPNINAAAITTWNPRDYLEPAFVAALEHYFLGAGLTQDAG